MILMIRKVKYLCFFLAITLLMAACEDSSKIKTDFSTPMATFKTLQTGIAAWDTTVIWTCMRESDLDAQNKAQYMTQLQQQKKTLQECFAVTEMSNIITDEPDYKAYMLRNCRNVHDSDIEFGLVGSVWKVVHLLMKPMQQFPDGNP